MLKISKASAGSGKTFLLAKEYISLLLGYYDSESDTHKLYIHHPRAHDTHKRILAITFTIKATEEMKKRIVEKLHKLSIGKEDEYLDDLMKLYNASESEIRHAAQRALRELLSKFSFFNVSTIDSFFQMVLRAMAYELDRTGDFALEINDDTVLNIAVQDLVGSLRSGYNVPDDERRLRSKIEKYLMGNIDGSSDWNILPRADARGKKSGNGLSGILNYINSEGFKLKIEDINEYFKEPGKLEKFRAEVNKKSDRILSLMVKVAKQLPSAVESAGITESQLKQKNFQPFKVIYAAMQLDNPARIRGSLNEIAPNKTFIKNYNDPDKLFLKGTQADARPIIELLENYLALYGRFCLLEMCIENLDALSLIFDICKQMDKYKEENDTMLLSQTTEFLSRVITKENVPFIYERMGVYLYHFLIDEFQDTSRMQWQNLEPMLDNSLSEGNDNLIIGDVKQSIYRFRNAEPGLLHTELEQNFAGRILKGDRNPGDDTCPDMSTNYRSRENIVKFNNTFFSLISELLASAENAPLLRSTYANVVQRVAKKMKNTGGYVTITFIDKPAKLGESENPKTAEESKSSGYSDDSFYDETLPSANLDVAVAHAVRALANGYRPCDIALLARSRATNEQTVQYLIRHLAELTEANRGVPVSVVSEESLLLKNSSVISTIIGMLRFLSGEMVVDNNCDSNDKNRYLPLIAQYFHRLWAESPDNPSAALQKAMEIPVSKLRDDLKDTFDVQNVSLTNIVERIIDTIDKPARDRDVTYLLAFQDVIVDYVNNYDPTIPAFLKWWDNNCNRLSITTPPNENAINVMTIHKSKGLEFQIVIIPKCDWSLLELNSMLWFDTSALADILPGDSLPPVLPLIHTGKPSAKGDAFTKKDVLMQSPLSRDYCKEVEQALADVLNITYVAFTRAQSELHIIAGAPSPLQPKAINRIIKDSLLHLNKEDYERLAFNRVETGQENQYFLYLSESLSWGVPTSPLPKAPDDDDDKLNVEIVPLDTYEVSEKMADPNYSADIIPPDARGEGIRLHKIMEHIRTIDDVSWAVRRCASMGIVREKDIDSLIGQFRDFLMQEEPASWFVRDARVLREQWLIYKGKQQRADRIVIYPDGRAVVVDYKFGEDANNIYSDNYYYQVRHYLQAMKGSGFDNVVGKIWHPESGLIRTVTLSDKNYRQPSLFS